MAAAVLLAICLLICQSQSQLCGPGGVFPGLLGYENGPFGAGIPLGGLSQSIGPSAPAFVQVTATPCRQAPSCGTQIPPCGVQAPPCGVQAPPCGIQAPQCGAQASPCLAPISNIQPTLIPNQPCGQCSSPCGLQIAPTGVSVPSYDVQMPPCGLQVPPCGLQVPIVNNIAPNFIPNQSCGQCSSFIPNQCGCSSFGPTIAPIVPNYDYVQAPVIDNTLANSLANALQLLIVSNLLESTLATGINSPICETVNPYCGNVIEVVTPDYYPCNQIVSCEPVYEPYIETPCVQESIFAPCLEVNSIPAFDSCFNNFGCSDMCGLNPYAGFGCLDNVLINPFSNCGCPNSVFSPVAAEVLFPAEIPAQLMCNFGYMSNNVPCVSVNVEPLPFDICN